MKESKKNPKSSRRVRQNKNEGEPVKIPSVQIVTRQRKRELSAAVEPCYCGEEDHRQVEIYEIDNPDRITAKFIDATFHLSLEDAEKMAGKINKALRKSQSTKTQEGTKSKEKEMATKKTTKKTQPKEISNKGIVYQAFKKGITDRAKLLKLVRNRVKETTIRSWLASWKRKENLPAIAKA